MFNVRIKTFYGGEQVQIFSHSMASEGDRSFKKCNPETGEIYERIRGHYEHVPFEDEDKTLVTDMPDLKYSAYKSFVRTKKTVYDIARANCWEWFLTFTFSPDKVDRYSYEECASKMSNWLKYMRKQCPDMVYLVVPEKHKDGAFHFHGLFSNCFKLGLRFSGYYDNSGRPIFNVGKYNYGFTTATQVSDSKRAASYLSKYITKDLCSVSMNRKRYWVSHNAERPIVEEYLLENLEDERLFEVISSFNVTHMKKVHNAFVDVTYLEVDQSMRKT